MEKFGRYEDREDYESEPQLADYLHNPERLSELSLAERERLLASAEDMARETIGATKQKYIRFIQAAKDSTLYDSAVTRDYSLIVDDEYRIRVDGQIQALETRLGKISNYSELITIGVKLLEIDLAKSTAYRINLTGEDQSYFINLKLFKIYNKKDGSSANYLYIADRYVRPDLRGKKIGEQLLGIADSVARVNDCSLIFGKLIAEEPAETELLKQGHTKVGYTIDERKDGEIIVSKEINENSL